MLAWFQALLPREERFFDHFEAHAATLVAGAAELRAVLEGGEDMASRCAAVAHHEEAADRIAREVLLAVRRTFITPFDRSDIRDLAVAMDDAIDQMNRTARTILLFDQTDFTPDMRALGDLITRSAGLTREAVPHLRNLRAGAARLNAIADEIAAIEEESDRLCDQGRRALFLGEGRTDPMAFLIRGEIYQNLEKVVDRFEDVANQISGMLIEHL
jgi:predicted phosphate transport protein (TIGR00153 family)